MGRTTRDCLLKSSTLCTGSFHWKDTRNQRFNHMTSDVMMSQIRKAIAGYTMKLAQADREKAATAMLSGMSLVAEFLAKADGSATITPRFVSHAIHSVAREYGAITTKIDRMPEED